MKQIFSAPRGTQDILPKQVYKWQHVKEILRQISDKYRIKEIMTPTFEHTELFCRSVGDITDVVQKEMYTFDDKGNRSITLRPEGTAGTVRAVIQNNLLQDILPIKLYYFVNCFRYDKPQAGRFREFNQFGVEIFGATSAKQDAETINFAYEIFSTFNLTNNLKLIINSIGCNSCRKTYMYELKKYLKEHEESYCKTCKERITSNPLRVLDCKEKHCTNLNKKAPQILNFLCIDCKVHFEQLKLYLDINGIKYTIDDKLVRGLDYYNRTVFEFVMKRKDNSEIAACGGGRYDSLVETLGGSPTPAFGFGLGLERLILLLEEQNYEFKKSKSCDIYVAETGELSKEEEKTIFKFVNSLRESGLYVEWNVMNRSLKAQMKYANKIEAKFCVIMGKDEFKEKNVTVKNMQTSEINNIPLQELTTWLNDNIKLK